MPRRRLEPIRSTLVWQPLLDGADAAVLEKTA